MAQDSLLLETRRDAVGGAAAEGVSNLATAIDHYGTQAVANMHGNKLWGPAERGLYFVARTATPGTGVAGHAAPTAAPVVGTNDTKPFIVVRNGNSTTATNKVRIYLDYIKINVTAAGTNGTNLNWVCHLDSGPTSRYSSGTTVTLTANNTNGGSVNSSNANIQIGPYVATAGSASTPCRILGGGLIRPVINVVGDVYKFTFGASHQSVGGLITSGTGITLQTLQHPQVILDPGNSLLFYLWSASQSAASSHEVEVGFAEY